ncbi:MAG: hypothetical protein J7L77_07175 [Clostridiales bacterium]|nr:hypothetical protein [Clostridiales bacterium]
MKKILSLVLISFMLISTGSIALSYQGKNSLNSSVNAIEASVCPKGSVQTTLTITADPSNTETCNITLTPDKEWILLEVSHFTLSPGASRQVRVTLTAGEKPPGTYQGSILMTSNCKPQSVEVPVTLHILEPTFSVTPESIDVKQVSYDEKTVNFYIQNGQCAVNLKVSSSNEFEEGNLFGITFQKSISLLPYQKVTFPVTVKTEGLTDNATIQMFFDSPYVNTSEANSTHTVTTTINIIPLIVIEGEIIESNEGENYLIIETIGGKRYKIILREEDKGKYKKGEYVKVEGYYNGEVIYPERITPGTTEILPFELTAPSKIRLKPGESISVPIEIKPPENASECVISELEKAKIEISEPLIDISIKITGTGLERKIEITTQKGAKPGCDILFLKTTVGNRVKVTLLPVILRR